MKPTVATNVFPYQHQFILPGSMSHNNGRLWDPSYLPACTHATKQQAKQTSDSSQDTFETNLEMLSTVESSDLFEVESINHALALPCPAILVIYSHTYYEGHTLCQSYKRRGQMGIRKGGEQ